MAALFRAWAPAQSGSEQSSFRPQEGPPRQKVLAFGNSRRLLIWQGKEYGQCEILGFVTHLLWKLNVFAKELVKLSKSVWQREQRPYFLPKVIKIFFIAL